MELYSESDEYKSWIAEQDRMKLKLIKPETKDDKNKKDR